MLLAFRKQTSMPRLARRTRESLLRALSLALRQGRHLILWRDAALSERSWLSKRWNYSIEMTPRAVAERPLPIPFSRGFRLARLERLIHFRLEALRPVQQSRRWFVPQECRFLQ